MKPNLDELLAWCESVMGPLEVLSDHTREHPGERASITRLRRAGQEYILKAIPDAGHWHSETHAYERWAGAFGAYAPRLLAARAAEPRAVLLTALPGSVLEETPLPEAQQRAAWRKAGQALAGLHALEPGPFFGRVLRDGSPAGPAQVDAQAYLRAEVQDWLERGQRIGCLSADELSVARAALALLPAFAGERPTACHRDYCPANWLVDAAGEWRGVIDFEFAYWDVRSADFARYPFWEWMERPDLIAAFFEGYGRPLSPREERQRLFSLVNYAIGAVVWGCESGYLGFAAEGRSALKRLGGAI